MLRHAFTLIELLVIVTIIVVLLALLSPALDRAIYQAELVQCSAKQDTFFVGVTWYTNDHRRYYPNRPGGLANNTETNKVMQPNVGNEVTGKAPDMRPIVRKYIPVNTYWQCPLSEWIDLEESQNSHIWTNYMTWFGTAFTKAGDKGMIRRGDQWQFMGQSYDIVVGDWDRINRAGDLARGAHPDPYTGEMVSEAGVDQMVVGFAQPFTGSSWVVRKAGGERGPLDTNFAFSDGSVRRYSYVEWDDPRMDHVGTWWYSDTATAATDWNNVPRQ